MREDRTPPLPGGGVTLTLSEAATRLGVEHDTLRRQIRLGKLKARKLGPIWVVSEKEVERYRRESRRGPN
jgi:excisionase family DNA binding protein